MLSGIYDRKKPKAGDIVADTANNKYEVLQVGLKWLVVRKCETTGPEQQVRVQDVFIIKEKEIESEGI